MKISDQLYFVRVSKVWSMLHDGSVEEFTTKNATLFLNTSIFFVLYRNICVFIIFISFFDEVSKQGLVIRNYE